MSKKIQREIDEVRNEEIVDKSTAIRMLVDAGYKEWKYKKALAELRQSRVSLWQAAKLAGMPLWEFIAILKKEEGIEWVEFNPRDQLVPRNSR